MPKLPCERSAEGGHLRENVKHRAQVSGRNTNAGITNSDNGVVTVAGHTERNAAAMRCVFGGVMQQVQQHLCEPARIAVDDDRLRWQRNPEVSPRP
jgi:hypothetical protein